MSLSRTILAVLCAVVASYASEAPANQDLVEKLLHALRPVPDFKRQENVGAVIREFKAHGLVPFRPQRVEYTDFYPLLKRATVFGHDLVLIEEEYLTKFIGCCVNEGGGLVLRINGALDKLENWAEANQCRIEQFRDEKEFLEYSRVRFAVPPGAYARISCRVRDEER